MSKKITCLFLAVLLTAALFTVSGGQASAASGRVYTFNVNLTSPEPAMPYYTRVFRELEQESGGRLKFDIFYANSLVAITDIPRAIHAGSVDISVLPTNNFTSQMPLNSRILQFPFMGLQDPKESVKILTQLQREFPEMQKEFDDLNMVNLGNWAFPPYHLQLSRKDREVRVPADMRGMRIMSNKLEFQELFAASGAAQVQLPPPEVYSALEKSVIDGFINNYSFQIMFSLTELINSYTELGPYGGWLDFGCTVMNRALYQNLPQDLRELITKKFAENSFRFSDDQLNLAKRVYDGAIQRGSVIVKLTEAELNEWKKLTAAAHEKALAEISRNKPVAGAVYKRALELIAATFK